MSSSVYNIVRNAVLNKQQVFAIYKGYPREMCPHVIGMKNGREKALFYQFGGTSSSGKDVAIDSPQNWRCLFLDELTDVTAREGRWYTAGNHSSEQTCVDDIDVEVT
ncbi:hypothetical protein FHY16_000224 [Xanthomonas campestris]|uniref:hypothetical protein n=1 Tax=Xanthomonas euroxanthea TaxID=2259622 RepID=UPI0016115EE0|nr:hypothetical protein [Xanthomonas euroxanthea]MBB3777503.1 hypothetical protein [Xanthomonas euroxanthea]